jgi:hypothetical protein
MRVPAPRSSIWLPADTFGPELFGHGKGIKRAGYTTNKIDNEQRTLFVTYRNTVGVAISSGQLRNIAAILRASSLVSNFAAESPPRLILEIDVGKLLTVVIAPDKAGVQFLGPPSAPARRLIFRRTCSTSEKPAVSLKATSPSVANSGRPVANEPDDATSAAASVAALANLLVSKRIDDPVPWDQFDANFFQHRWGWSMYRDRFVEFAALAVIAVAIAIVTYAKLLF